MASDYYFIIEPQIELAYRPLGELAGELPTERIVHEVQGLNPQTSIVLPVI